jgi:hypothetical protein
MVGLAAASKWPAGSVAVALVGAAAALLRQHQGLAAARKLVMSGAASIVTLLAVSPFLLLDWQKALHDIFNEGKPAHLGHTGNGPIANLLWYADHQVIGTMGWIGAVAIIAGMVATVRMKSAARWTLLPAAIAFIVMLAAQNLVWSRWILPLLPLLCLLAAAGAVAIARTAGAEKEKYATAIVAIALLVPSAGGALGAMRERANDTRDQAADWAVRHFPAGSTVVIEHLQISLRDRPWTVLFPLGAAGCLDGKQLLSRQVKYEQVDSARDGAKIVDLGNIAPDRIQSCRADYAILSYYDLYLAERSRYPRELATYDALIGTGRTIALFRPTPGKVGGPVIRIVAVQPGRRVT